MLKEYREALQGSPDFVKVLYGTWTGLEYYSNELIDSIRFRKGDYEYEVFDKYNGSDNEGLTLHRGRLEGGKIPPVNSRPREDAWDETVSLGTGRKGVNIRHSTSAHLNPLDATKTVPPDNKINTNIALARVSRVLHELQGAG